MTRNRAIAVSGNYYSPKRLIGISRFTIELLRSFERIPDAKFQLVIDKAASENIEIRSPVVPYKYFKKTLLSNIIWVYHLIKTGNIGFCTGNGTPISFPRTYTVIHDIAFKADKNIVDNSSMKYILYHRLMYSLAFIFAKHIFTDSEFSKSEILKFYKVKPEKITVIGCGWQHFVNGEIDDKSIEKYGLKNGEYFFSMATVQPNKNFKWVVEAAKNNPDKLFIIGGECKTVFRETFKIENTENIRFLGYLSDDDVKVLMKNSKAFLFPTLYEGFGLPPLEALSVGAPIIVSDIPVMKEIYGDSARYINPFDYNTDLDEVLKMPVAPASECLEKYSWDKSAQIIYDKIKEIERWTQ